MRPKWFTKHSQYVTTTYCEDMKSMPGASGRPKPKFLTRTLVIDDYSTTTENCACSTQEVDAGAAEVAEGADAAEVACGSGIEQDSAPAVVPPVPPPAPPGWQ